MEEVLQEFTTESGQVFALGNLIPDANLVSFCPNFGDTASARVIPRSEWEGLLAQYDSLDSFDPFLPPVQNQRDIGSCNANTTVAMVEYIRRRQGLPYVQLSPADLYHRVNRGRDAGSLLEDAMREVTTNGIGTAATSGFYWGKYDWRGPASQQERRRFRVLEVLNCRTFDHCMSAVLQGFALNTGIMWYDNYTPGSDGWLPRPSGRAGGHAIFGFKPAKRGAEYGIWHMNSWGADWPRRGSNGLFVIPESAYVGPVGGWFAVRAVVDEGGIVPNTQS